MPVVIHRAIYGSLERFIGIIIENFKGIFPFWLSPSQVGIVPIREEHNAYAKRVFDLLQKNGIRAEADYSDRNMKEKIKNYKQFKTPYILVLGDREAAEQSLAEGLAKGLARGNVQGFVNACRDFGVPRSEALVRVARRFNLTDEDARSEVERCWEAKENTPAE